MDSAEVRILWRLFKVLALPRPLTRADKKSQGLKYCRYAGYGYRWCRGKRVPDPAEQQVIAVIVDGRNKGHSWNAIARHLLHQGTRRPAGGEWSRSRVRRAYLAAMAEAKGQAVFP